MSAAIWTLDKDFLGCGLPTWTTETLLTHLAAGQDLGWPIVAPNQTYYPSRQDEQYRHELYIARAVVHTLTKVCGHEYPKQHIQALLTSLQHHYVCAMTNGLDWIRTYLICSKSFMLSASFVSSLP